MAQDEEPSANGGGSGSVKFSISKRKQVRSIRQQTTDDPSSVQFVTSSDQIIHSSATDTPIKPIPRLDNTWRPEKRMKNLVSHPEDELGGQEFVNEVIPAGPVSGVRYGLSVRSESTAALTQPSKSTLSNVKMDILQARESRAKAEKQALETHLDFLPESASPSAYELTPVDSYGEALLAGMGWTKGGGVGKLAVLDVKAFEFVRRPDRLGLGAVPAPPKEIEKKRRLKPGESRERAKDMVAAPAADGKVRHRVEIDEKLVERVRKGVYGGKVMSVIRGKHAGLKGEVLGDRERVATGEEPVTVKLVRSGETVHVYAEDLADVGSLEEEKAMKKMKEVRIAKEERRPWLRSQIRVRIVSKRFREGKLYLKKGRVIDVVSPTVCSIVLDESGDLVEGVKQEYLETALPKKGGRVMVVGGEHRGSVGKLEEKDSKSQTAVVELEETFEMVALDLDYLAEYTGDGV